MAENQLIPGQPLRNGMDLVADKKTGALIVVGTSPKLERISSGGISLTNCSYTPEMLSELAKMDGAIVVDSEVNNILKANVHLNPSDNIATSQTGTRHRTAQRVSVETGLSVIAVSEESSIIKVLCSAVLFESLFSLFLLSEKYPELVINFFWTADMSKLVAHSLELFSEKKSISPALNASRSIFLSL